MSKRKKWLAISAFIVAISIVFVVTKLYIDVKTTAEQMYVPLKDASAEEQLPDVNRPSKEPFSVLLLGVDEREGEHGRSDTIVVLTVNASQQSTKMISIPRDTYTEIAGKGVKEKINHAFAYGGREMAKATVEQLFNIPIDYVVQINMTSFVELVDVLDGITVHNTFAFHYDGEYFPLGDIQLDGERALKYVRMRYDDPNGDFGRQHRQKLVIEQLTKKALSMKNIFQYEAIFEQVGENVKVNATFQQLRNIQKHYTQSFFDIEQLQFQQPGDVTIDGIYYYQINEQELADIQRALRQHLELM